MAKKKTAELIAEWMAKFGEKNGYELARTELVKEGGQRVLRVFVDKLENGAYGVMGIEDCEKVSNYLNAKLDEADPIEGNYLLEVSSPGLDRPLLSEKDFMRFMGSIVEIRLYEAIDGKKLITGELKGYRDGEITIRDEKGKDMILPKGMSAKVNLAVIF